MSLSSPPNKPGNKAICLRDITVHFMSEVCHARDMSCLHIEQQTGKMEPHLDTVTGNFWLGYYISWIFNLFAPSYANISLTKCYRWNELEPIMKEQGKWNIAHSLPLCSQLQEVWILQRGWFRHRLYVTGYWQSQTVVIGTVLALLSMSPWCLVFLVSLYTIILTYACSI